MIYDIYFIIIIFNMLLLHINKLYQHMRNIDLYNFLKYLLLNMVNLVSNEFIHKPDESSIRCTLMESYVYVLNIQQLYMLLFNKNKREHYMRNMDLYKLLQYLLLYMDNMVNLNTLIHKPDKSRIRCTQMNSYVYILNIQQHLAQVIMRFTS